MDDVIELVPIVAQAVFIQRGVDTFTFHLHRDLGTKELKIYPDECVRSLIKTCDGAEYSLLEDGVGRFIWHCENCVWEFQAERIARSYLEALISNTYEATWNKIDPSAW